MFKKFILLFSYLFKIIFKKTNKKSLSILGNKSFVKKTNKQKRDKFLKDRGYTLPTRKIKTI